MTDSEQPPAAEQGTTAAPARRAKRTRIALIGTGGAAVVLAGGALLAAQASDSRQSLPEPAALAPLSTATPTMSESAPAVMASAAPSEAAGSASAPASPSPSLKKKEERKQKTSEEVRKEIKEARAKAAADGVPLKRPLKQKAAEVAVNERTVTSGGGTIRITTARGDLTGQRALSIAADEGERVGDGVRCTNRIRFSEGVPAQERPTVLLCWRTSAKRSVVTMAVTPEGKPAPADSIALIRQEWTKLG